MLRGLLRHLNELFECGFVVDSQLSQHLAVDGHAGGLKTAGVAIDRKMLAELAVNNEAAFKQLVEMAKKAA